MSNEFASLEQFLDRIKSADNDGDKVAVNNILDELGRSSFAPLLIFAGVITVIPVVGDIPGVPTVMGLFVLLTTGQMLFQSDHFWLPKWLLQRSIGKKKLDKGLGWMYKPAKFIDRWTKRRFILLVNGAGQTVIASVCLLIALVMPLVDIIPLSGNIAGMTFILFGLAIITHDGLLALFALLFALGTFGILIYAIF